MARNSTLNRAKVAKQDEYYTRREDIEAELSHYERFFRGKVVYCNCDDPVTSEFWQFFARNYHPWGLKKLLATHYEPNEKNFTYKLDLSKDTNGDGVINLFDEPEIIPLQCNGDFRSADCIEILKEADIVCTNPPFSQVRDYLVQLLEYNKDFVCMAPLNAVKYRDVFPLIRDGKMWLGYKPMGKDTLFRVPPDYAAYLMEHKKEGSGYKVVDGEILARASVIWLTNLDIDKRHDFIDLRGNYYKPEKYPKLANFDAIYVKNVADIPCDYDGVMAVPITYAEVHNPNQFELLGKTGDIDFAKECGFFTPPDEDEYKAFRKQNVTWRVQNGYFVDSNGVAHTTFDRFFIKNKHPEKRRFPDV